MPWVRLVWGFAVVAMAVSAPRSKEGGGCSKYCERVACRRMQLRTGEGGLPCCARNTNLALVRNHDPLRRNTTPATTAGLVGRLSSLDVKVAIGSMEPYFRARHRHAASRGNCGSRVAVLLPGAVRTMVTPEAEAQFKAFFRILRRRFTYVHVFAWLDTQIDDSNKFQFGVPQDEREVWESMSRWGVQYTIEQHRARGHPLLRRWEDEDGMVKRECTVPLDKFGVIAQQFIKVHAATNMMQRFERGAGRHFDIVLRLRPDLCLDRAALEFFRVALVRTSCASTAMYLVHDVAAVYPRWAASAYANFWRAGICVVPPGWSGGMGGQTRGRGSVGVELGGPGVVGGSGAVRGCEPDMAAGDTNGTTTLAGFVTETTGITGVDLHYGIPVEVGARMVGGLQRQRVESMQRDQENDWLEMRLRRPAPRGCEVFT